MHIRVTRARFDPGQVDKVLRLVRENTLPAARQLPRFKGFRFGIDRAAGRFVAVTAFETGEQTQAMSPLRAPAEAVGLQFEPAEVYEVVTEG